MDYNLIISILEGPYFYNLILFGLFSFLSIFTINNKEKIFSLKIQNSNNPIKNINKIEYVIYCLLAIIFLYVQPQNNVKFSFCTFILSLVNNFFGMTQDILLSVNLLITFFAFITFIILIIGIYLNIHRKQFILLYPSFFIRIHESKLRFLLPGLTFSFLFGFFTISYL